MVPTHSERTATSFACTVATRTSGGGGGGASVFAPQLSAAAAVTAANAAARNLICIDGLTSVGRSSDRVAATVHTGREGTVVGVALRAVCSLLLLDAAPASAHAADDA